MNLTTKEWFPKRVRGKTLKLKQTNSCTVRPRPSSAKLRPVKPNATGPRLHRAPPPGEPAARAQVESLATVPFNFLASHSPFQQPLPKPSPPPLLPRPPPPYSIHSVRLLPRLSACRSRFPAGLLGYFCVRFGESAWRLICRCVPIGAGEQRLGRPISHGDS
jgi:hypothetical protein